MPIKLTNPFPRRRSSGNLLEEAAFATDNTQVPAQPPQSSFRVLARPGTSSFEHEINIIPQSAGFKQARPASAGLLPSDLSQVAPAVSRVDAFQRSHLFSGKTLMTAHKHDNSSSSARYSSSSTLPSSTEIALEDRSTLIDHTKQTPSSSQGDSRGLATFKAVGKTFPFVRKKVESSPPATRPSLPFVDSPEPLARPNNNLTPLESFDIPDGAIIPPKLPDDGFDFGENDDFSDMFEAFGKRRSQTLAEITVQPQTSGNVANTNNVEPAEPQMLATSATTGTVPATASLRRTFSYEAKPERVSFAGKPPVAESKAIHLPSESSTFALPRQNKSPSQGLRRSSMHLDRIEARREAALLLAEVDDDDARLFLTSIEASRQLESPNAHSNYDSCDDDKAALLEPQNQSWIKPKEDHEIERVPSAPLCASPKPIYVPEDPTPLQEPQSRLESLVPTQMPTKNKIMTPAQFELYRKQQEMNHAVAKAANDGNSDDDQEDYDDEDDADRKQQLTNQRKKQEAHLAVYRQQMRKVTRESRNSNSSSRSELDLGTASTIRSPQDQPSLKICFDASGQGGSHAAANEYKDADEDENVPLGVLAAHGFPSKNRPPSVMTASEFKVQYKSETYPSPTSPPTGKAQEVRGGALPPFARGLPKDPYYGAGIVSPTNRESMAPSNMPYGSKGYGHSTPNLHPGGLVGVIAGEEQARAARRSSPGMQQQWTPPGSVPADISPSAQHAIQLSDQMQQMMQMQTYWMQQVQQMVTGMQYQRHAAEWPTTHDGTQPLMNEHYAAPKHGMLNTTLPLGLVAGRNSTYGTAVPQNLYPHQEPRRDGRAMSLVDLNTQSPWLHPTAHLKSRASSMFRTERRTSESPQAMRGYTASIAPSERSNVSIPTRYRPVTVGMKDKLAPAAGISGAANTPENIFLRVPNGDRRSVLSASVQHSQGDSMSSGRSIMQGSLRKSISDEEEEDMGWQQMKQQRDAKKGLWRSRRRQDEGLVDVSPEYL